MGDRRPRKGKLGQKQPPRAPERRLLRVIVICYLFLAGLYATAIPPGKGPDETAHLRYISYLAEHHGLPVFDRQNPGADYEFHQPPLYYLVCLPTYSLSGSSPEVAAQTVRFVTILIGLAVLYLTFALGRALLPDQAWVAVAAAAVVAFLPAHLSVVSTVGNDALTEVFVTAALLLSVRYLRSSAEQRQGQMEQAPSAWTIALAGVMIGLGLLTKSIAVVLLPVVWAAAALAAQGRQAYEWRRLVRDLAVSSGPVLVIAGWWLWRNLSLYGDILAGGAFLTAFQDRPSPAEFMERTGLTPPGYVVLVAGWTLASSLGAFGPVFGNRFVFYPYWVYVVFGAKALIEVVGFIRSLARDTWAGWQRQAWWLCALLAVVLLAGFIRFNLTFFQAQARYLFPALPPAAVALCLGLRTIAPPRRWQLTLAAGISLLLLLAIAGLYLWIVPQFRLPAPVLASLP